MQPPAAEAMPATMMVVGPAAEAAPPPLASAAVGTAAEAVPPAEPQQVLILVLM